jgi:hypothetical protein
MALPGPLPRRNTTTSPFSVAPKDSAHMDPQSLELERCPAARARHAHYGKARRLPYCWVGSREEIEARERGRVMGTIFRPAPPCKLLPFNFPPCPSFSLAPCLWLDSHDMFFGSFTRL